MTDILYQLGSGQMPEGLDPCAAVSVAYPFSAGVETKCAFEVDWKRCFSYSILPDILQGNRIWKHSSGRVYYVDKIINTAHPSDRFPPSVVYTGANGEWWGRRVDDWHRSFTKMTDEELEIWNRAQEFRS